MSNRSNKLVDQSQALDSFFESLMRDVEAYEENENDLQSVVPDSSLEEKESNDTRSKDKASAEQVELVVETKPEPVNEVPVVPLKEQVNDNSIFETLPQIAPVPVIPPPVVEPVIEPEVVEAEQIIEAPEPELAPLGKPEWAESDFQAMMFKVAGLTLAVPLVELNGIVECDLSEVTAMPGSADFYLGLMTYLDKSVPLVDTARFVLPADKLNILAGDDPQERITRVVMIQDCQYGLACDEVNEVITLSPDSVRWRSQRTQRRWLAGTVVEHMCALIDANAFAELLANRTPVQDFRE